MLAAKDEDTASDSFISRFEGLERKLDTYLEAMTAGFIIFVELKWLICLPEGLGWTLKF